MEHTNGPWMTHGQFVITGNDAGPIDAFNPDDAALISAAPELLEVLESAMNYINRYGGEVTSSFRSGGWGEYVDSVIRKARGL